MRSLVALFAIAALGFVSGAAAQPTTYTYTGANYIAPTGTFTTAMRITGSFTTANPLPRNMPLTPIGPAGNGLAVAWSFSNGVDTFTEANSSEIYATNTDFMVATDNLGNISNYSIGLVTPLPPHIVGTTLDFVWISRASNQTQALDGASCAIVTGNLCTFIPFAGSGTLSETDGGSFAPNFVRSDATSLPIPATNPAALGVLALLMAACASAVRRRR